MQTKDEQDLHAVELAAVLKWQAVASFDCESYAPLLTYAVELTCT
jgi:hypothetical protein